MGQGVQEWTKKNLWKTALKNLKLYGLPNQILQAIIPNTKKTNVRETFLKMYGKSDE